jgi:uncharacterized protein YbjT (DUF2867 family)
MTEETLRQLPVPVAFLRAGWFMENASCDLEAARNGVVPSFLQPLDHVIPMVATADMRRERAKLLPYPVSQAAGRHLPCRHR